MFLRASKWGLVVGLAGTMLLTTGCTVDNEPTDPALDAQVQEKRDLVRSMNQLHEELLAAGLQIQRAISAIDDFSRTNDLKRAYAMYNDSVAELKIAAEQARLRGVEMRENREEYLIRWLDEVSTMSDPLLKDELEARRVRIRENFDRITELAAALRDAYPPFVTKLEDIQKALKLDLTPAGIQAIHSSLQSAKQEGEGLAKRLDEFGIEVDALRGKLAPSKVNEAPPTTVPAAMQ